MTHNRAEKHQFFMILHTELALRHGLTLEAVSWVRSQAIGRGLALDQIREALKRVIRAKQRGIKGLKTSKIPENEDLKLTAQNTLLNIQAGQALLAFLTVCSPTQWQDLTQLTQFDRSTISTGKGR